MLFRSISLRIISFDKKCSFTFSSLIKSVPKGRIAGAGKGVFLLILNFEGEERENAQGGDEEGGGNNPRQGAR